MAQLSSDTVLQRAPLLNLELDPSTITNVSGRQIVAGNHVLPILEAFTHPVAYSQAVKTLSERVTGVQGWIEFSSPMNRSIVFRCPPHEARDWQTLASPFRLANLDLSGTSHPLVNESAEFAITRAGQLGGLLVYFELDVAPGHRLSTSPAEADETCSWWVKTWMTASPIEVKPEEKLKVSYKYRVDSPGNKDRGCSTLTQVSGAGRTVTGADRPDALRIRNG